MLTELTEKISKTLAFAQEIAPNSSEQQEFANMCEEMRMSGEREEFIVISLVGAIYDGLKYGNWPSTSSKRKRERR